jgi:hypothetical protein
MELSTWAGAAADQLNGPVIKRSKNYSHSFPSYPTSVAAIQIMPISVELEIFDRVLEFVQRNLRYYCDVRDM